MHTCRSWFAPGRLCAPGPARRSPLRLPPAPDRRGAFCLWLNSNLVACRPRTERRPPATHNSDMAIPLAEERNLRGRQVSLGRGPQQIGGRSPIHRAQRGWVFPRSPDHASRNAVDAAAGATGSSCAPSECAARGFLRAFSLRLHRLRRRPVRFSPARRGLVRRPPSGRVKLLPQKVGAPHQPSLNLGSRAQGHAHSLLRLSPRPPGRLLVPTARIKTGRDRCRRSWLRESATIHNNAQVMAIHPKQAAACDNSAAVDELDASRPSAMSGSPPAAADGAAHVCPPRASD